MKISELISFAQKIHDGMGDLDVIMITDTSDGLFYVQEDVLIDVVEIPKDEYGTEFESPVFAIMWPDMAGVTIPPNPILKVVK